VAGGSTEASEYRQRAARRLVLILVFVRVGAFIYSEDVVEAVKDVTAAVGTARFPDWLWVWGPLAVDTVLILASWPLKRRVAASDGGQIALTQAPTRVGACVAAIASNLSARDASAPPAGEESGMLAETSESARSACLSARTVPLRWAVRAPSGRRNFRFTGIDA
jgi:hypothetical protein